MYGRRANFAQRSSEAGVAFWTPQRGVPTSAMLCPGSLCSRRTRKSYGGLLNLSRRRRLSLNGRDVAINSLNLRQQRIFALGEFDQLSKCRARDVCQHLPLCAVGLGLQPSKISYLGRLTNGRDHGARANNKAAAKGEHEQDPDREGRQSSHGFTDKAPAVGQSVSNRTPQRGDSHENNSTERTAFTPGRRQLRHDPRGKAAIVDVGRRFAQLSIQRIFLFHLVHTIRSVPKPPAFVSIFPGRATHLFSRYREEYPTRARLHRAISHSGSKAKRPSVRAAEANSRRA